MGNNIKNRLDRLVNKLLKQKVHVVFIENDEYTYYLSNAGNEGQTVSQKEYEVYKRKHEDDEDCIFIEISFANSARRLEDFE